ncbi:MAG: hypothetical protein ACPGVT_03675 [Maricaulaceae bacterium]
MSDEEAKAKQEIAKTTGKGIDLAEKAGGFFSRVFGLPIEDTVGALWGDKIRTFRIKNAIDLANSVQEKMDQNDITDVRVVAPKIAIPLIESASLEDDPIIIEMWENLLLSAVNSAEEEIDKNYVKTLDLFTGSTALFLSYLYENRFVTRPARPWEERESGKDTITVLGKFSYHNLKNATYSDHDIRSLIRFGVVDSTYRTIQLGEHDDRTDLEFEYYVSNGIEEFEFTDFGINFCGRVIGK